MTQRDPAVQELLDREAIRACLYRYCRGIDRCDVETLKSAYWPEAADNHVYFNGNAWEFAEWVVPLLRGREQTMHMITNAMFHFDGADAARVESQYVGFERVASPKRGVTDMFAGGRYLDRFERRGEEWRILHRDVYWAWFRVNEDTTDWSKGLFGKQVPFGQKCPDDPLYTALGILPGARG
jgi:hypothetical protein